MLLLINSHHLRQPRSFAAVGPCIAISAYAESVGKVVGLMKVEVSLFAGLLVIATTLLLGRKFKDWKGRCCRWRLNTVFAACARVRPFSTVCRAGLGQRERPAAVIDHGEARDVRQKRNF